MGLSGLYEGEGFDDLTVDCMGDDCFVLSQLNERGKVERVAVSRGQLIAALAGIDERYSSTLKNTDCGEPVALFA